MEEEAEEEVNKVLEEIAGDIMTALPGAPAKVSDAVGVGTALRRGRLRSATRHE